MKYSYNWLKEFIPHNLPEAKELADILNYYIGETTLRKQGKDFILEIDIAVNRFADLGGHLHLARDIAAFLNLNFKSPVIRQPIKITTNQSDDLAIEIQNTNDCLQYCGLLISDVKICQSPLEIREKLISCGLRPINNIVDLTNFIMLEYNQPMHAFDYDKISSHKIVVRRAQQDEKITTLDNRSISLNQNILVIADSEKPLAIAGIKGGKEAEISKYTQNIVLESANFDSSLIYTTSKNLNLITDASIRFSHNLPKELTAEALQRAAQLIQKYHYGIICGPAIEASKMKSKPKVIILNIEKTSEFLGFDIKPKFLEQVFHKLEINFIRKNKNLYLTIIPYWRQDLSDDNDLIGEIGRIYGFNNIKAQVPQVDLIPPQENDFYNFKQLLKDYSLGFGLSEVMDYHFIGAKEEKFFDPSALSQLIKLKNPLSSSYKYLRPFSLVSSLRSLSINNKYFFEPRIFEIAKNFFAVGKTVNEVDTYSFGLCNSKAAVSTLLLEAKGIIERLFESFGIGSEDYFISNKLPTNFLNRYAPFILESHNIVFYNSKNQFLGALFVPKSKILEAYSLIREHQEPAVVLAEFNLESLYQLVKRELEFQPLPKYPSSIRDIAILVPENTFIQDIEQTIKAAKCCNLADVDIFDIYEGLKEGKSVSFHLVFRSDTHTLTDDEINQDLHKIIEKLKKQGWKIR